MVRRWSQAHDGQLYRVSTVLRIMLQCLSELHGYTHACTIVRRPCKVGVELGVQQKCFVAVDVHIAPIMYSDSAVAALDQSRILDWSATTEACSEEICDPLKVTIHSCNISPVKVTTSCIAAGHWNLCYCITSASSSLESTLMHPWTPGCACSWPVASRTADHGEE